MNLFRFFRRRSRFRPITRVTLGIPQDASTGPQWVVGQSPAEQMDPTVDVKSVDWPDLMAKFEEHLIMLDATDDQISIARLALQNTIDERTMGRN